MTPTEKKAREIYERFYPYCNNSRVREEYTKQCALICVDEIIKSSPSAPILSDAGSFVNDIEESTEFYKEVKKHIEKL